MKRSLLYREPRPGVPLEHRLLAYALLVEGVVLAIIGLLTVIKAVLF